MASSTGAVSRALARLLARRAKIVATERLTDDIVAITLEAPDFRGVVWTPGDKVQIVMGSVFESRTYTPIEWDAQRGRTRIVGYLHGNGPACAWLRAAVVGDTCDLLGPRHSLDVRKLKVGRHCSATKHRSASPMRCREKPKTHAPSIWKRAMAKRCAGSPSNGASATSISSDDVTIPLMTR